MEDQPNDTRGANIVIREAIPQDYDSVVACLQEWWAGEPLAGIVDMLPRLFFVHFRSTTFVAVQAGRVVGFVTGFLSQSALGEAYIHFVGVNPAYRRQAVGASLYERFCGTVAGMGRSVVRCVTRPTNHASLSFHARMGFVVEGRVTDYDGPGNDRVLLTRRLVGEGSCST
jgi:ribosomal protein S18 acetylase RimI-like enzyme